MNKIPEGWEACSIEEAQKAWTPWGHVVEISKGTQQWVSTPSRNYIYSPDWALLGIIPIRKVKPKPFQTVVASLRTPKGSLDKLYITVQVPREGEYRVTEVVE